MAPYEGLIPTMDCGDGGAVGWEGSVCVTWSSIILNDHAFRVPELVDTYSLTYGYIPLP
jgi:hypothetical protein